MQKLLPIIYKELNLADLHPNLLQNFNRFQETTWAWVWSKDRYNLKEVYFIDNWDVNKKQHVILSLRRCITAGGSVVGAYLQTELIGFANVESAFLGNNKDYLELNYLHVTQEYRHQGIGKNLFQLCCQAAKNKGARKLYIGAHPAAETIAFYQALGCRCAQEINFDIYLREPRDVQLELLIDDFLSEGKKIRG